MHLFDFSPLCVFKWVLKSPARVDAKSHWLHLFVFSPLCVFKWILNWPAWCDAYLHWLHLLSFFPMCIFKCVTKKLAFMHKVMHTYNDYICSFLSIVSFHKWPQSTWIRACILGYKSIFMIAPLKGRFGAACLSHIEWWNSVGSFFPTVKWQWVLKKKNYHHHWWF